MFPAALTEASSPDLLRAIRAFAEQHDLGYTIHLAQSRLEIESMMRLRGVRPTFFLHTHDFLSPRLFAAHCRYVDAARLRCWATRGRSSRTRLAWPPDGR